MQSLVFRSISPAVSTHPRARTSRAWIFPRPLPVAVSAHGAHIGKTSFVDPDLARDHLVDRQVELTRALRAQQVAGDQRPIIEHVDAIGAERDDLGRGLD